MLVFNLKSLGLQNCQVSDFPLLSPPMVLFWVTVTTLWLSDLISSLCIMQGKAPCDF